MKISTKYWGRVWILGLGFFLVALSTEAQIGPGFNGAAVGPGFNGTARGPGFEGTATGPGFQGTRRGNIGFEGVPRGPGYDNGSPYVGFQSDPAAFAVPGPPTSLNEAAPFGENF